MTPTADPSAFIARAREAIAANASASTEEGHWLAKVALRSLAVNALPALLEVAEKAGALRSAVGYDTFDGVAWDTTITALDAALARLAEVPGE